MNEMNHWGLNAKERDQLGWTDAIWDDIKTVVSAEAEAARKVRPALPPFGEPFSDPDNIFDYSIDDAAVISIPSRQRLVSAELSRPLQIRPDQHGNAGVAKALATRAAHQLGVAEDAALLLGAGARDFLRDLNVAEENLDQQSSRLIQENQDPIDRPILDSILEAIQNLRNRGEFGGYRAIVAPDLYRQAFQPQQNLLDAPIHQIRAELVEDGFHYSQAAPEGTGAVISLGGGTLYITVPVDPTVSWSGEVNRNIVLNIVERFRLLVNIEAAVEPLR